MRPLEYYLNGPKEAEEHRPTKTFSKKTQSQTTYDIVGIESSNPYCNNCN